MSEPIVTVRWRVPQWPHVPQGYTSRRRAEQIAADLDGTVQRVTTTIEDVGLRWVDVRSQLFRLYDGKRAAAVVCGLSGKCMDHKGPAYSISEYANGAEWVECATLDEAKAAAENAVRESWT